MLDPYQYPPILHELAEAMRAVLNAQEFLHAQAETGITPAERLQAEYGNVRAAMSRVRNAFIALDARETGLVASVRLSEKPGLELLPSLSKAIEPSSQDPSKST